MKKLTILLVTSLLTANASLYAATKVGLEHQKLPRHGVVHKSSQKIDKVRTVASWENAKANTEMLEMRKQQDALYELKYQQNLLQMQNKVLALKLAHENLIGKLEGSQPAFNQIAVQVKKENQIKVTKPTNHYFKLEGITSLKHVMKANICYDGQNRLYQLGDAIGSYMLIGISQDSVLLHDSNKNLNKVLKMRQA